MTSDNFFLSVSRGDQSAAEFLSVVFDVAHVWDDLIDKDVDVADDAIDRAFFHALVTLPRNPFYAKHFDLLNPLLLAGMNNWHVANELEKSGTEEDLRIAFISRSGYIDLITQVAFLVGGSAWVREAGPAIRRFVHQEGWQAYLDSLKKPAPEQEGE